MGVRSKSRLQNPPRPRWAELPVAQGARRRRSRRSATPTTSNAAERRSGFASSSESHAARRSKSAQPFGLRRQAAISGVTPPRRTPGSTPASSFLGSGRLALATRLARGFETGSKGRHRSLLGRAGRVKLLVLDVDGVLTDGRIVLDSDGDHVKIFNVRDGFGLVLAAQAGLKTAIITAEKSPVVTHRARQLKISWVAQFARDKAKAFQEALAHFRIPPSQIAYIGDDLLDLPVLTQVGFSATVSDAHPEVKRRVHYVTSAAGGQGAVREVVELILKAQGKWPRILKRYLPA